MNTPNQLTLLRILLSFCFLGVFLSALPFAHTAAFLVFIGASLTDVLDGRLARRHRQESDFGKLLDPLADKILVSTAFISFVQLHETGVRAWMVVLIITREFLITGLRLVAMSRGELIQAGNWGKHKTFWQMFAICFVLSFLSAKEYLVHAPALWVRWGDTFTQLYQTGITWTMGIVVGLTVLSGTLYVFQNRRLLLVDAR